MNNPIDKFKEEMYTKTKKYQKIYGFEIGTGKHDTWNNEAAVKNALSFNGNDLVIALQTGAGNDEVLTIKNFKSTDTTGPNGSVKLLIKEGLVDKEVDLKASTYDGVHSDLFPLAVNATDKTITGKWYSDTIDATVATFNSVDTFTKEGASWSRTTATDDVTLRSSDAVGVDKQLHLNTATLLEAVASWTGNSTEGLVNITDAEAWADNTSFTKEFVIAADNANWGAITV